MGSSKSLLLLDNTIDMDMSWNKTGFGTLIEYCTVDTVDLDLVYFEHEQSGCYIIHSFI